MKQRWVWDELQAVQENHRNVICLLAATRGNQLVVFLPPLALFTEFRGVLKLLSRILILLLRFLLAQVDTPPQQH